MREGHYGTCGGCKVKIPLARLKALPYAATCIECQRSAELNPNSDLARLVNGEITADDLEIDIS